MIARNEPVKVLYAPESAPDGVQKPIAIIINGKRPPTVYRLTELSMDELSNLLENGDPDQESAILKKP